MMCHFTTPVKGFTGTVVGVAFNDGVGHTDDHAAIAYFNRHDYGSVPPLPDCAGCEPVTEVKELTPKQKLQAEAKELGIDAEGTADDLKARIAEHKANAGKQPADPQTPPSGDGSEDEGSADGDKGGE